jgi:hypothetical protein
MAEESDCPDGKVNINGDCVSVEEVDGLAPSVLNSAPRRVHQLAGLRTEPIERIEEGDEVRYANLALLEEGVWTDQASETPTLYPSHALDDIQAEYNESEYDGPPINTRHDLDEQTGEVNDVAVAGYVDPDSLRAEGDALLGDLVLETDTNAGAYADDVLQSSLESGGSRGFGGPSVELDLEPERHLTDSDHPEADEEITGGYLTGLGLVDRPASKTVGFGHQTASRPVAMSADTPNDKTLYTLQDDMNADAIRDALEQHGVATDDLTDEELTSLHEDMMDDMEMAEHGDDEDDDMEDDMEDDEDADMGNYQMMDDDAQEVMRDMIQEEMDDIWSELDKLKEQMMDSEEMAAADEVAELREALEEKERRLSELENQPKQPKTLADSEDPPEDHSVFEESDTRDQAVRYDPATGSTSY